MENLHHIYRLGDEVIYCGFTSSTLGFTVACRTANYGKGTILEFTLLEGFQLDNVSVHPSESEVLLPPNKRFVVTSAPIAKRVVGHKGGEGGTPEQQCKDPSSY